MPSKARRKILGLLDAFCLSSLWPEFPRPQVAKKVWCGDPSVQSAFWRHAVVL